MITKFSQFMSTDNTKDLTTTNKVDKHKQERTESYEYLFVVELYKLGLSLPENGQSEGQGNNKSVVKKWKHTWWIHKPNISEAEERSGKMSMATLFNELGADGWKLVNSEITHTAIVGGQHFGLDEVAEPMKQRCIFIRRRHS
jgi:hypothetical protein